MSQIKISVVTVCFNAAKSIERTIQSVMSQQDADIEYVVVDGASTDGTMAIVNRYANRISTIVSEKDGGIFDAMNKGIGLATGDVVYFLNADDAFADPRVLADVGRAFMEDPSRTFVYGNVILEDEPGGRLRFPASAFKKRSVSEFLHNSFCHQAVFVRRSLFSHLGTFDKAYKYSADYEWIIRAFKRNGGRDFYFLERDIAFYSCLGRSNQHVLVTRKEVNRMQRKHFASLEYAWYFFRYVWVRGLKKRLMNESY
jgi:glycosyltransferase involved in cell wall biosynthesis